MEKEEAIYLLLSGKLVLENLPKELRAIKEVVIAGVSASSDSIYYASDKLKNDKDVILAAVEKDGCAIYHIDKKFRKNKKIILKAVNQDGMALEYVDDGLRCDRDVVMATVGQNGAAYMFCDEKMQRDIDIIELANKNLIKTGKTVDNYLCDALIELKKKYGAQTLELALEMEVAEEEVKRLHKTFKNNDKLESANIRL